MVFKDAAARNAWGRPANSEYLGSDGDLDLYSLAFRDGSTVIYCVGNQGYGCPFLREFAAERERGKEWRKTY